MKGTSDKRERVKKKKGGGEGGDKSESTDININSGSQMSSGWRNMRPQQSGTPAYQ